MYISHIHITFQRRIFPLHALLTGVMFVGFSWVHSEVTVHWTCSCVTPEDIQMRESKSCVGWVGSPDSFGLCFFELFRLYGSWADEHKGNTKVWRHWGCNIQLFIDVKMTIDTVMWCSIRMLLFAVYACYVRNTFFSGVWNVNANICMVFAAAVALAVRWVIKMRAVKAMKGSHSSFSGYGKQQVIKEWQMKNEPCWKNLFWNKWKTGKEGGDCTTPCIIQSLMYTRKLRYNLCVFLQNNFTHCTATENGLALRKSNFLHCVTAFHGGTHHFESARECDFSFVSLYTTHSHTNLGAWLVTMKKGWVDFSSQISLFTVLYFLDSVFQWQWRGKIATENKTETTTWVVLLLNLPFIIFTGGMDFRDKGAIKKGKRGARGIKHSPQTWAKMLNMLCRYVWFLFSVYQKKSTRRIKTKSFCLSKQALAPCARPRRRKGGARWATRGEMDD